MQQYYNKNSNGFWLHRNGASLRLTTGCHRSELFLKHTLFGITRKDIRKYNRSECIKQSPKLDNLMNIAYKNGWINIRLFPQSDEKLKVYVLGNITRYQAKIILNKLPIEITNQIGKIYYESYKII